VGSPPDRTAGHDVPTGRRRDPGGGLQDPSAVARVLLLLCTLGVPATYAPSPSFRARPHAAVLSSRPHPRRNIFPANVRERRAASRQTDAGGVQAGEWGPGVRRSQLASPAAGNRRLGTPAATLGLILACTKPCRVHHPWAVNKLEVCYSLLGWIILLF
jgi:hypothetical protein